MKNENKKILKTESYQENEFYRPDPETFQEQVSGRPPIESIITVCFIVAFIIAMFIIVSLNK